MPTRTLLNTTTAARQYVRLSPLTHTESQDLTFVYIGKNSQDLELNIEPTTSGIFATTYHEAKTAILNAKQNGQEIDALIMDVLFDEKELVSLHIFLKENGLNHVPVLYNEQQLVSRAIAIKHHKLIDDVIDLPNGNFDLNSKVRFLKKAKQFKPAPRRYSIETKKRVQDLNHLSKRAIDITIAALLLILLIPVFQFDRNCHQTGIQRTYLLQCQKSRPWLQDLQLL
jgi:hypothetical protein